MKDLVKKVGKTSACLLESAGEVFAEKGYRDATIAEICERAGANIAAVNYYFGDKETLYREAWLHAFRQSITLYPPGGGVSSEAPAEERLRGYIVSAVRRITETNNREFRIIVKEMSSPTGLLEVVLGKAVLPLHRIFQGTVRELLGPHTTDKEVEFCTFSIISQWLNPILARAALIQKNNITTELPTELPHISDIKAYTEHVFRFSLAGIYAYRDKAEKESSCKMAANKSKGKGVTKTKL